MISSSSRSRRGSSQSSEHHAPSRHFVFRIGSRLLALPVSAVREIVDLGGIIPVPESPAFVLGIASLRGAIMSVIDTGKLLFEETSSKPSSKVLVLVRDDLVISGLTVDGVHGVVALAANAMLHDQSVAPTPFVLGHHDLGLGDLVAQLDLPAIYSHIDRQRTALHPEMS